MSPFRRPIRPVGTPSRFEGNRSIKNNRIAERSTAANSRLNFPSNGIGAGDRGPRARPPRAPEVGRRSWFAKPPFVERRRPSYFARRAFPAGAPGSSRRPARQFDAPFPIFAFAGPPSGANFPVFERFSSVGGRCIRERQQAMTSRGSDRSNAIFDRFCFSRTPETIA